MDSPVQSSPSKPSELRRGVPHKPRPVQDRDRVIGFDLVNAVDAANAVDPKTITGDEYRTLLAIRVHLNAIIADAERSR